MHHLNTLRTRWIAAGLVGLLPTAALACPPDGSSAATQEHQPAPAQVAAAEDVQPVQNVAQQRIKARLQMEKELRKVRAKYLGSMKNKEIRQVGIDKVRQYTDPLIYPALLSIFEREEMDVKTAILDTLAEQKTEQADATIAWGAVYDRDADYRQAAAERLRGRARDSGAVSNMVKTVIANGLKSPKDDVAGAAAELAGGLKLYEAISALINAQVVGGSAGALDIGGPPPGALADIYIVTQQAFVADLQPVVGDSAVGFDPTLGVVSEGTIMRVLGASVITYRTVVNRALVGLADSGWDGRSTAGLGWDAQAWRSWYYNEFRPYRAQVEAQQASVRK